MLRLRKKPTAFRRNWIGMNESLAEPYPDDLDMAGAIVTIDHEGKLRIERNLIRKEDMKKLSRGNSGEEMRQPEIKTKPAHSEKLTRMLTAHRTAAIQAVMANRPDVALAALVHRLALQVFGRGYLSNRIVQVNIERPYLKPDAENIEQSRAAMAIEEKRRYWQERIEAAEQGGKSLFEWLLERDRSRLA